MALSVTNNLTVMDEMEADSSALGVLDVDFYFTGAGAIAVDCDIETQDLFNGNLTPVDMSGGMPVFIAMLCMTQPTLDIKANGGMGIIVKDSSGNISGWWVGGVDTYAGGWEVFAAHTSVTPDYVPGTATDMSDIVAIGAHFKCLAKSKLTTNCYMDRASYGTGPVLKITGTNTTVDSGWPEVLSVADAADATKGYMKAQTASYILKGPAQLGDDSGTLTTEFSDDFNEVVFGVAPVPSTYYGISGAGNATGSTTISYKNNIYKSAGERFVFDYSDANITSFSMTGSTLAVAGLSYFKSGDSVYGNVFNNCSQVVPSTSDFYTNTLSNSVDTGASLLWPGGTTVYSCTFINNDNAVEITQTTGQTFNGLIFDDVSGKFDVNNTNGGTEITISLTNNSNANSYTGTSTLFENSKLFAFDVQDATGSPLTGFEWRLYDNQGVSGEYGTELDGEESASTSSQSYAYNYVADDDVILQIIADGYEEYAELYTLGNGDQSVTVKLTAEENL